MCNQSLAGFLLTLSLFGLLDSPRLARGQEGPAASAASPTDSPVRFSPAADAFVQANIGNPSVSGSVTAVAGGYNITAGGTNIFGAADQFTFNYELVDGNFDYKVRLAGLTLADAWSKAGLMGRQTLDSNSVYACSLATPSVSGAYFQWRTTTGGSTSNNGNFPVNYPNTWLRLQRTNNLFTSYASLDGNAWFQLGSATVSMSNSIYVGMAVSASVTNGSVSPTITAQFRDFQPVVGGSIGVALPDVEPAGPSSRRTPFAITEIMYNPAPDPNSNVLEFIEIYNSNPFFDDLSGYRISGDVDYTFPPNTILQGGEYRVIAKNPAHVQSFYGITGVMGPYTNSLTGSGTVRLRNKENAVLLEVSYSSRPPWPAAADGAGHSLVLARPSYGERFPQAWGISDQVGGSPGGYDSVSSSPQRSVVINEFFANSEPPDVDYIELYNHSNLPVDLSGCALSDDSHTNKFLMPANTIIPARGFLALNQDQLGFCLSSSGETIYFRSADGRRVLDAVRYEPQARGVSSGRYPDGAKEFYPLSARTPGAANARILIRDIVINEIMYSPITTLSDDEYVELYNKSSNPVSLGGWAFTSGIDYTFPSNVVLAANNYLVVAKNVSRLLTNYANLNSNNTYGNYKGTLGNNGDRVALGMPDFNITTNCLGQVKTNDVYVVVDEVTYGTGGNWPKWADGGGSSLELIDPRSNHRQAHNWADSDETAKADWTTVEATGLMDNGAVTANWFEVLAMGEGEYLLDDAWAAPTTSSSNYIPTTNSNFEAGIGDWKVRGTMERSSLELTGGFGGGQCLHIRASTRGDTMANRCLVQIPGLPTSGSVTLRAQVRWLRGWPEILLRTKGNYMEAYGRLSVPANLGTPGLPNSRAATNAPPAIYEVKHTPVVPAAGQPVVVTARVDDPDGLASVVLNYRIDSSNSPAPIYMPVNMVDNGTGGDAVGGDGLYSAIIPAQPSGTMVAFQVVATDTLGAAKVFPLQDASYFNPFECLVRFGDPVIAASFGTYRQWMSLSNIIYWSTRATSYLNNEQIYETFVYGNFRAIYNARSKWASSPYHPPASLNPVIDPANYSIDMPPDDLFLGVANVNKVHAPGNGPFGDQTIQREQICYWMARQMGLPWGYRRYVNMFFNGNRRGGTTAMMEDAQTPGADMLAQFFPDEPDGNLFKLQPWFEQNDAQSSGANNQSWCTLVRFTTVSNGVTVHKTARYRNNYLTRNASGTANNFQPVFDLVDAANSTGEALTANFSAVTDTEEYFRILSVEHASGNWDAIGSQNQQNMYGYVTKDRKWHLMIWDWNIVLGSASSDTGSWGVGQFLTGYNYSSPGPVDLPMQGLFANPTFRRIYFRGLKELATGPMLAARIEPVLDAKYRAFLASGVTPVSPGPPSDVKSFISGQRSAILTFIAAEDAAAFKITVPSTITTNNNLIAITGEAPVEAKTIKINGMDYPITWTSVRAFRILIAATTATNDLSLQAYDLKGNPLPGFGANLRFVYTGSFPAPETALVINEIMYNPTVPEASYIELYNNSDFAFDLTGWRVNGLDFTFRDHAVIASHQYLVLAKNRRAFSFAYGGSVAPAGEFDGHLDLGGETLALQRPVLVYTTNAGVVITNIAYVTVNKVRYDDDPPWPAGANGSGPALQLIDPNQDNSRVSNWTDHEDWRYATYSGTVNGGATPGTNFLIFMQGAGDVYIDDVALVTGTQPGVGSNLFADGDFESPFSGPWTALGNHSNSVVSTDFSHSGGASLHLLASGSGSAANTIRQFIPALSSNTTCTLSFWFRPSTNGTTLTMRTTPGSLFVSNFVIHPIFATPGLANSVAAPLPAYDPLWLNELQPNNVTGMVDNHGEHDPWIELYNGGTNPLDLNGYYLANNYTTNLTQWQFPPSSTLAPGAFRLIWADGQPAQSTPTEWHANFRLESQTGSVALVRLVLGKPQITDYLNYADIGADLSYGDLPNGQPFTRETFFTPTPGASNNARKVNIFINEWMAANTNFLKDPADGHFDDWFELYNASTNTVDLGGYWLTDDLNNPMQFQIPTNYVIQPGRFLLVWADNEPSQNTSDQPDLHASFQLSKSSEQIGLFAPDGFTEIDSVAFGPQFNDVSQGRFSDGSPSIYFMSKPTPRGPNAVGVSSNAPPTVNPIGNRSLTLGQTLSLTVTASDPDSPPQTLSFALQPGFPPGASIDASSGLFTWTPTPAQAPSTNTITVRVTDSGVPPATGTGPFTVVVATPPKARISIDGSGHVSLVFGTLATKTYRVEYKDFLGAASWTPLGQPVVASGDSLTVPDTIGSRPQRFYRIVQVN